jgi:hypothetical protein
MIYSATVASNDCASSILRARHLPCHVMAFWDVTHCSQIGINVKRNLLKTEATASSESSLQTTWCYVDTDLRIEMKQLNKGLLRVTLNRRHLSTKLHGVTSQ